MASNQTTLPNVSENEETLLTGVNENVYEDQSIGAELTKKRYQPRRLAFHAVTGFFQLRTYAGFRLVVRSAACSEKDPH